MENTANLAKNIDYLYAHKNLFKLCLKTILPSLLLTLLVGIYIFIDQMLIVNLVPLDGHNYVQNYFININQFNLYQKISFYINDNNNISLSVSNNVSDFVAYAANHLIGPFSLVVLSYGYLISAGSAVIFSKALANKNEQLKNQVIWNSFHGTLIFSFFATILMLSIEQEILKLMIPNKINIKEVLGINNVNVTIEDLNNYANYYYLGTVKQAVSYLKWENASILFICFINIINFYLRAEGKNKWITIFGSLTNIVNIILDVILIVVIRIGIKGGGISTFVGQILNCLLLVFYLVILNKQKNTTIDLKVLIQKNYFSVKILVTSILLGLSTFLREATLAIANIVYVPVFFNTLNQIDTTALLSFSKIIAAPIYNLFFFAIFGIIDGLRPIISYNFTQKNFQRVRKTYFIGIMIAICFSIIVISSVFSILVNNKGLLNFLNATNTYDTNHLMLLLLSLMLQFPFISLSIGGLALFQSANKKLVNIVLSLMQGVITFYPILFLLSYIAINTSNVNIMVFTGFSNIVISSLIIFLVSLWFLKQIYLHSFKTIKKNITRKFLIKLNDLFNSLELRE